MFSFSFLIKSTLISHNVCWILSLTEEIQIPRRTEFILAITIKKAQLSKIFCHMKMYKGIVKYLRIFEGLEIHNKCYCNRIRAYN